MSESLEAPRTASQDERMWAMLCHLATFLTIVPLANVIVPLVIWIMKRDTLPLVADQGKEVLNFQITMMLYYLAAFLLVFAVIGIPLLIALPFYHVIVTIVAAIKAYDGVAYRYPLTLRLL